MAQSGYSGSRGGGRSPAGSPGEDLRLAEQAWLSRRLHDDLGPSLCAAGLQLSLLRSEMREADPETSAAFDNVQTILDRAVDNVRLLSYALCPAQTSRCGLRDMVRMMAKAFHAEVAAFQEAPAASPAAAVELATQLLDCLLVASGNGEAPAKILLTAGAVTLDAPGRLGKRLKPVASRSLSGWSCHLSEKRTERRTMISWSLAA